MTPESDPHRKIPFSLTLQDGVILGLLLLGFIGTLILYLLDVAVPPILAAILLASAISALVYRFLGGIAPSTSFAFGLFKISGTLAALIGCAYFINQALEKQTRYSLDRLFTPEAHRWFPVEKNSGSPLSVRIHGIGSLPLPTVEELESIPLSARIGDEGWIIRSKKAGALPLGFLSRKELEQAGFPLDVAPQLLHYMVTDRLPPGTINYSLAPLPFKLHVREFSLDYSHYDLVDDQGVIRHAGSIYRKQTEIVCIDGKSYLIAVVEVNHLPQENYPYVKFAIGEIALRSLP
ncbi:hypothetical protein JW992_14545 [candidate division KSB1 bacterium]|nr:hypothetical protein [candidate division KSB1 bacterium]